MNKRLHRVVFNAARGMRVAVQETARVVGKASGATPVVMAAVLMSAWPVSAQIAGSPGAPPNLRPTVLLAPNGVPLVNIQTPSAAGVSRNLYNQFDVQPRGVILNNSRTNVQTQLGGWVQGNPYLATGSARVILNEITSGNTTSAAASYERQTRGVGGLLAGLPMPYAQSGSAGPEVRTDTAAPSTITSGQGGVSLQAGGLLHLRGVQVDAARDIDIHGGVVDIQAAVNTRAVTGTHSSRSRGGLEGGQLLWHDPGSGIHARGTITTQVQDSTLTRTTLQGANVRISADHTLALAGTTVNTPGTLGLEAATLLLGTQTTEHRQGETRQGRDLAYQRSRDQGSQDQTTHYNQFNAGRLEISANRVQAGLGARDSIEQLAQQPGMGWVERLNSDPALRDRVDWVRVDEVHRNWDYRQQGLTPEGAAILTLVTAYFTAGAATSAGAAAGNSAAVGMGEGVALSGGRVFLTGTGATISTVVGGAVTAGVTALAAQASVALVNNRGDIAGALNDLGSSASVKNLLTAVVTGGVLASLNMNPTGLPTARGGAQPFMTQLGQNLTAGAARAVIGTAINGGSFERNLGQALRAAIVDTMAAQGANAIGDLTAAGTLDDFTNKFAHAIAGCMAGAARTDSASGCGAGALGAAIGELTAEAYGRQDDTVQLAALMGGLAVAITGGDANQIDVGSQAGGNAAANNYLNHADATRMYAIYQLCRSIGCTYAEIAELRALQAQDRKTTEAFNACAGDSSDDCKAVREDFRAAAASYLPTRTEILVWSVNKANESGGKFSIAEIYEAYNANVFGVAPEISTGDLSSVADWVRGEIAKEPPLSRIAMGLATYQNEQWAHYFGVNVAANLMAQARSMARPEPLVDKRPPTVIRGGELLDNNGTLIGRQNAATGQWDYIAPKIPQKPTGASASAVYKDPDTGLSAYNPTGSVSRAEVNRLAYDPAAKKPRTGEGSAAAEFQNAFGVRLERVNPKDYPPDKLAPDFKIVEGPNAGMTVDFMFTVDSPYAATHMNRNFMASPKAALELRDRIADHLAKAQIVPLDFRNLTADNQALLMHQIINRLPPAQRAQIHIIR